MIHQRVSGKSLIDTLTKKDRSIEKPINNKNINDLVILSTGEVNIYSIE